jgi:hypothetical protein
LGCADHGGKGIEASTFYCAWAKGVGIFMSIRVALAASFGLKIGKEKPSKIRMKISG